jgi:hypothetical protein
MTFLVPRPTMLRLGPAPQWGQASAFPISLPHLEQFAMYILSERSLTQPYKHIINVYDS